VTPPQMPPVTPPQVPPVTPPQMPPVAPPQVPPVTPPQQPPGGNLQIQVFTGRVDQNGKPTKAANEFQVGETVGALVVITAVPGALDLGFLWLKVEGDRVEPLTQPQMFRIDPSAPVKNQFFRASGFPPGTYFAGVVLPGPGGQMQPVAHAEFHVR